MGDNDKVFVTLFGDAIAVNKSEQGAKDTLAALVGQETNNVINTLYDFGEVRKTIRFRSALVYINK